MVEKITSNGFSKKELVALMGSHTIGFANMENSGSHNRWTQNPHVFDNTYFKEVLLGDRSKFLKTKAEIMLANDTELRGYCEEYAQDEKKELIDYLENQTNLAEEGEFRGKNASGTVK